jgi:tetratricopeptide (TPR) repeat protein/TolB-like protein
MAPPANGSPVTPERLKQIEDIYHAAIAHPEAERAGFVRVACGGDDDLRVEVESLLAQEGGATFGLERAALAVLGALGPRGNLVGRRLGAYQVTAVLGAGGMGDVYRATDTKLGRDVAVKVLPAAFSADPERLRRFEQEARLLAALNHSTIGAIYGLEEAEGVRALILELVEGPTLADRLAEGPIALPEALSIARQIASALEAAHGKGIIHRDLKPANIKITPQGLVKVLDFGIAKPGAADRVSPETREGVLLGTASYLSPEQARGQPVDARADVWAFGCVLYEMLVGRTAFTGSTTLGTIAAILERDPDWHALPTGTPTSVGRLIHRCLEKERDRRISDARELQAELERIAAEIGRPRGRPALRRLALVLTSAAVLVTVFILMGVILVGPRALRDRWFERAAWRSRSAVPVAPGAGTGTNAIRVRARRAIAVMGFQNLSRRGEAAWLSPALSETLTMELASGGALRAIPGESVARMKIDLDVADVDSFAQDTLARIRKNIGADLLVLGSYLTVGREGEARIRLDLRLQDAATGEVVATVTETAAESELLDLVSRTGARLRERLGVGELSPEDSASARASLPASREVVRLYAEGLDKLRLFDALGARDLLERAISADPDYALAHAALASAWSALGYDARAIAESKKALDLAGKLSREQRLAIEGSYQEMAHDWNEAAKIYKALWTVFPDNLDYGLRLAEVYSAGGKGKEALAVVGEVRSLPAPSRDDPRIDLAEVVAAGSLSDFKRQQAAAERAATKGNAQGSRLLLAQARLLEGRALYEQGQLTEAAATSREAREIYTAAGDRAGAAAALNNIASVLSDRGEVVQSTSMHREAAEIFRQIGNKKGMANALNNIAVRLKDDGDLPGARKIQEQVLTLRRDIGDRSGAAVSLSNVGVIVFEQGNLASARRMYEESLSICREIGDKRGMVRAMLNIAIVLSRQGDLAGAGRLHEESLAIRREIGDKRGVAVALINLADVLLSRGDLAAASAAVDESMAIGREIDAKRTQAYAFFTRAGILEAEDRLKEARTAIEEALAIREQLRETLTIVESRIGLAGLAIEMDQAAEAEALARSAAEACRQSKQTDDESLARVVLARALLAQGRAPEARHAIAEGWALVRRTGNREMRLELQIIEGRVNAVSGQAALGARAIESARREAAQAGLAGLELEARLALGETEMRSDQVGGRDHLESVRKDATGKGFLLIARKAVRAMGGAS